MGGRTRGVWTEGSGLECGCGTAARTGADGAQAIRAARDPGPGPSHHAENEFSILDLDALAHEHDDGIVVHHHIAPVG